MSLEPDDSPDRAWDRFAQLHPVHPDERFLPGSRHRLQAPAHWLVLGGILAMLALVLIWLAPIDLGSTEIRRVILALLATLAVGCGLVALRRHRLSLGRQPATDPLDEPERPFALSIPQAIFILVSFGAMLTVLLLTARASLVSAVMVTALLVLLAGILLAGALAATLHAIRWRRARRVFARRHREQDLGYLGIWDRT